MTYGVDVKRDQDKMSEQKQQLMKVVKRDEMVRKELAELKKSSEALAASSAEKLKAAQLDKRELEATLDKVSQYAYRQMHTCFFVIVIRLFTCYFGCWFAGGDDLTGVLHVL